MSKIGKQRKVIEEAFESLGGLSRLIEWANSTDSKGDSNYRHFISLYVKLAPNIKVDKSPSLDSQEQFIKMIMEENKDIIKGHDKPTKLIEGDVIEIES